MNPETKIKVGIGFATGRRTFQKALRTNIHNWKESGLVDNQSVALHLFVAYDLSYDNTKKKDYTKVPAELAEQLDGSTFIGKQLLNREIDSLCREKLITREEAKLVFRDGYAGKRNALLYLAIKNQMDCLVFMDDDEYPMAVTNKHGTALWGGQDILSHHLKFIDGADITYGYHCGYVSPIPWVAYDENMGENDFRLFISAISNDIIRWESLKEIMNNGGVSYADIGVLTSDLAQPIKEEGHAKFISGSNLCVKTRRPHRVFPFFNPPGARGEDTFLSTCLSDREVLRVPCYAFHDGFGAYKNLLEGALPIKLRFIKADNRPAVQRFYKACIGWVRYKPLLLYITRRDEYESLISEMKEALNVTLPKVASFFGEPGFLRLSAELEKYHRNVERHFRDFRRTQEIWGRIMEHLEQ